jgi:tRNA threonylcarbamoyladenosine biosynthesis protein TsaE
VRESLRRLTATCAEDTRALGRHLAAAMAEGDISGPLFVALSGDLGAGKTTFVAGFLERFGHAGPVRSPTYTLVEPYLLAGRDIHHCDLYRLRDPDEIEDLGLRELRGGRHWLLVEWPERAAGRLGTPDLEVHLEYEDQGRAVSFTAGSEMGHRVLSRLRLDPA